MHGGKSGQPADDTANHRGRPSNTMNRLICGRRTQICEERRKNWVSIEDVTAWAIADRHCLSVVRLQWCRRRVFWRSFYRKILRRRGHRKWRCAIYVYACAAASLHPGRAASSRTCLNDVDDIVRVRDANHEHTVMQWISNRRRLGGLSDLSKVFKPWNLRGNFYVLMRHWKCLEDQQTFQKLLFLTSRSGPD